MNQLTFGVLNGLVVGSSLALVAAGLALQFGVMGVINFAQGDFYMLGGYVLVAAFLALQHTKYGIWLRGVAQNRTMAAALGVPVTRVFVVAFMVSIGLAALAGGLLVPITSVYPTVGADVILNAFIIVVAGG